MEEVLRETLEFETCLQECPARVFHKSGCYKRVCYKRFTRVSRKNAHKSVPQDCLLQECPTRVSRKSFHKTVCYVCVCVCYKGVLRRFPTRAFVTRVSYKSVPHEFSTRTFSTRVCVTRVSHTSVSYKSVPQECQTMFGRLFWSACVHSRSSVPYCFICPSRLVDKDNNRLLCTEVGGANKTIPNRNSGPQGFGSSWVLCETYLPRFASTVFTTLRHLVNFLGTDTVASMICARDYYGSKKADTDHTGWVWFTKCL